MLNIDFEFTGDLKGDAISLLKRYKRERIAEHTLRVCGEAEKLAVKFGANPESAAIAALLHDIGGIFLSEKRIEVARSLNIEILKEEEVLPLILHQKISKVMAEELFKVHDREILSAIGCHTTLKAKASKLDMITFIADKIEWDQGGVPPYLKLVQSSLEVSLELAVYQYIKYIFEEDKLVIVHPWMRQAYNHLSQKVACM